LHEKAREGEEQNIRIAVAWDLGGTGKAQLVLSRLPRFQTAYIATFWVEAGQTAS